jgi:hypothetical protein
MIGVVWRDIPGIPVLTFILKRLQLIAGAAQGFALQPFIKEAEQVAGVGAEGDAQVGVF